MTHTNHTDSVEAAEKEYQRQLALSIKVGEKQPHISAFISAWDMYDGMMNDCYMTAKDRAQMRKMLTTLQATTSQQVEEAVERVAKAIYDEMVCDDPRGKPDWVPRGNLIKQVEARRKALQALTPNHQD